MNRIAVVVDAVAVDSEGWRSVVHVRVVVPGLFELGSDFVGWQAVECRPECRAGCCSSRRYFAVCGEKIN